MATTETKKRITDVDTVDSLNSNESFFINQNSSLKQVNIDNVFANIANKITNVDPIDSTSSVESFFVNQNNTIKQTSVISIANGGTNATNAEDARNNLGITPQNIGVTPQNIGAQIQHIAKSATLAVNNWSGNAQTVNVSDVTRTNTVIISSHPSCQTTYTECEVLCIKQGDGNLTFNCGTTPSSDLQVNIIILD